MNPNRDLLVTKTRLLVALGLALVWGLGGPVASTAQDSHAGHDHQPARADSDAPVDAHVDGEDGIPDGDQAHAEDHAEHAGPDDEENADEEHADEEHAEHADDDHGQEVAEEDDHAAHGDEEEGLRLTPEQLKRFGIVVQSAGAGSLRNEVSFPGEIVFNEDRVVHLVPRVGGIARKVHKSVGDKVNVGEILAVIESRELADTKSEYLAAKARGALAENNFVREKALREKQVSSEQDYLEAEQSLAEARIELRSAEQKLHALGLTEDVVEALDEEHDDAITRYEIRSPIAGVVTEKHISLGESLEPDADIFTVVDMSSVWVNLTVYTKNLGAVSPGQEVTLRVEHSGAQTRGKVTMVTPFVEESTRSAKARVILDNSDGRWMPGTFVTGFCSTAEENLPVVVSRDAVQNIEGREVVFVEHEDVFEIMPVRLGRMDRTNVEVTAGLEPGTRYVSRGAFQLKATVVTSNLGSHAGHGH